MTESRPPLRTRVIVPVAVIAVLFVIATVLRGSGVFLYDAASYWDLASTAVGNGPPASRPYFESYFGSRGALSAIVYTPAALVTRVFGDGVGPWAVVVQNAIVLALAATLLLPRVIAIWRPVTLRIRIVTAVLAWIVLSGFAAYPLMDAFAALAIVAFVVLTRSTHPVVLAAAGVVGGVAINLRPASLAMIAVAAVLVLVWRRWRGLFVVAGIAIALLPQVALNLVLFGRLSPVPTESAALVALQSGFASYIVRYDTLLGDERPQQFYCSPDMATLVGTSPPQSVGDLMLTFLRTIPQSIQFALEKVGAALDWSIRTPYSAEPNTVDAIYGIAIIVLTGAGITALVFTVLRARTTADRYGLAMVAGVVSAGVLTLVGSATETRFALVLVLFGIVGIAAASGSAPRGGGWRTLRWILVAIVVSGALIAFAVGGLSHPAPRGVVTPALCQVLDAAHPG